MNFGLHILPNPNGTYSFVGSVPAELMDTRKPIKGDVMGGRVDFETGLAYVGRVYQSVDQMVADAKAVGANLCSNPKCACARLLKEANHG